MAEPGLDDVFSDDITVPAMDGYPLAATLFLPRGAKRHAVLINSATAVPRRLYRGFAGYLARRGCAVLTYDYRGTGDSRQQAPTGSNQPKSLVGFNASMSDWGRAGYFGFGRLDARALQGAPLCLCRTFVRRARIIRRHLSQRGHWPSAASLSWRLNSSLSASGAHVVPSLLIIFLARSNA